MTTPSSDLDVCGACAGTAPQTPAPVTNRAGLATIARRVGTQPQFKQTMESLLGNLPELRTRSDGDFTIGLVDAWAGIADVLTFYQERIGNESYLRTAGERRSLTWLAELVGYVPQPGVAAGTWLAFTMTAAPGAPATAPGPVEIPAGTRLQSVPGPGELPLTFETTLAVPARVEWNAFRPSLSRPQPVSADMPSILFSGVGTGLKPGDSLVIVPDDEGSRPVLRTVATVTPMPVQQQTLVSLRPLVTAAPRPPRLPVRIPLAQGIDRAIETLALQRIQPRPLDIAVSRIAPTNWSMLASRATVQATPFVARAADLRSFAWRWRLRPRDLFASLAAWQPPATPAVYALRTRASLFGHNAPDTRSLPTPINTQYSGDRVGGGGDWQPQTTRQQPVLDTTYPRIAATRDDAPSFAAMTWTDAQGPHWLVASVDSTAETGMSNFTLTGKATSLNLSLLGESDEGAVDITFNNFAVYRGTSVLAESEPLVLARLPRSDEPLAADSVIDLDTWVDGLHAGQNIVVTGELDASRGTTASEVVQILEVDQVIAAGGYTSLTLASALLNAYVRDTVTINGNVAAATHGSTVQEVLGSGDATRASQSFTLRQSPLTYVSAPTASGVASTLALRINGVLWSERPNFFGSARGDRIYTTRLNDDGTTTVTFGDGINGARPASGSENIVSSYRKGIGAAGNIAAGRLSLLQVRPLGVQSVTNPVDASGGTDADGPEDIRTNAALTLRALDRIVSLQDYEDFARAFGGIAKSLATWSWHGQSRGVFVTVAGIEGADVPPDSPVYQNLLAAIADAAEPNVPVRVASYRRASFTFGATLMVDPARDMNAVLAAADAAARAAWAFDARAFGQPVPRSEVIALLQAVPGVVAVRLSDLRRTDNALFEVALRHLVVLRENTQLNAALPQLAEDNTMLAAELLTLDARPLDLKAIWAEAPPTGATP
ncbi:putative baseplate assembly protein [Variovorax humicola]|uniref:Baseplate assembly protein n=1 Tax=Variovorax humicola TaxID=1769758 RepID=A0ABU8VYX6_9BURK